MMIDMFAQLNMHAKVCPMLYILGVAFLATIYLKLGSPCSALQGFMSGSENYRITFPS